MNSTGSPSRIRSAIGTLFAHIVSDCVLIDAFFEIGKVEITYGRLSSIKALSRLAKATRSHARERVPGVRSGLRPRGLHR